MGNQSSYQRKNEADYDEPLEKLKFATEQELMGTWDVPCPVAYSLVRYMGSGETWEAALESLRHVCVENGVPLPEKVYDQWCIGTVNIQYIFKVKRRLNPVWHKNRNGRHFAFVYYPPL